ncbi:MAG: hypothetical protein ABJB03_12610 [Rhodoglobus sp.]
MNTWRPRFGTILLGIVLLVIAVIAFTSSRLQLSFATPTGIVWIVVGIGALLILAAIIGSATQLARRPDNTPGPSARDGDQPIG